MATVPSASIQHQTPGVEALVDNLLTMANEVEHSLRQTLHALRGFIPSEASQVFLRESQINRMEVEIDEQAVRLLAHQRMAEADLRLVIASLRITNDLERLGDLAINIAGRIISLAGQQPFSTPRELILMADAVEDMVCHSLRALSARRVELAQKVLESDDVVDGYADRLANILTQSMSHSPEAVPFQVELLLISRTLERIADHATNVAEDVIFWLRGLDVRHHLNHLRP